SCMVGPQYVKPDVATLTPTAWRWHEAQPTDHQERGEWWKIFGDNDLNRLQELAAANNQELRAAVARLDQARALLRSAGLALSPDLKMQAAAQREQTSGNLPSPVPVSIPSSRINT